MRVFANRTIKTLFIQIALCMAVVTLISAMPTVWGIENVTCVSLVVTPLCVLLMGAAVLYVCYRYFRQQDMLMEDAVAQIRAFVSGDKDARIACDEEGELYRLFHEINSLAAILTAQARQEGQSKEFLKNTISDISHQLKTPLAALNIYNGIMQTEAETGGLTAIQEFTGLSEQEVERHFAFRAGQEGKQIVLEGDEAVSFLCDRSWLAEALDNLVKNALDHTESGDSIWIHWGQSPSAVSITVKDNGSGIHPEDLHHIFKRFYRSRYSQDTQGIGLGLSLVKAVVEAHGGTIGVDSRLGNGTTFVLVFPMITRL